MTRLRRRSARSRTLWAASSTSEASPIKNAVVEIWQVDHNAIYLAERDSKPTGFDANFQGFGRFQTGSSGEYRFRTIKPVPYPGRLAPHIHFKIKTLGRDPWTTQLYIKGYSGNQRDGIYRGIGDAKALESVTVDFTPIENSRIGELAAKFDIVLGFTPGDNGCSCCREAAVPSASRGQSHCA